MLDQRILLGDGAAGVREAVRQPVARGGRPAGHPRAAARVGRGADARGSRERGTRRPWTRRPVVEHCALGISAGQPRRACLPPRRGVRVYRRILAYLSSSA